MWDEPPLPALGTPERERLDAQQAAMVAGLLAQYRRFAAAAREKLTQ